MYNTVWAASTEKIFSGKKNYKAIRLVVGIRFFESIEKQVTMERERERERERYLLQMASQQLFFWGFLHEKQRTLLLVSTMALPFPWHLNCAQRPVLKPLCSPTSDTLTHSVSFSTFLPLFTHSMEKQRTNGYSNGWREPISVPTCIITNIFLA